MKKITTLVLFTTLAISTGCMMSGKLPSVTVGAGANHDNVVALKCTKEGVGVTVPLVDVDVPLPTVKLGE